MARAARGGSMQAGKLGTDNEFSPGKRLGFQERDTPKIRSQSPFFRADRLCHGLRGHILVGALGSLICVAALSGRGGQYRLPEDLSTGRVLLANEKLTDPNFRESVILV